MLLDLSRTDQWFMGIRTILFIKTILFKGSSCLYAVSFLLPGPPSPRGIFPLAWDDRVV